MVLHGLTTAWLATVAVALAQPVSFGIKAGVPLGAAVEGSFGVRSAFRPTVGLALELRLPASFAFEVNALYRRAGYGTSTSEFGQTTVAEVRANAWEFPLLAKYYLVPRHSPARLFVSGGYVVRNLTGAESTVHIFGRGPTTGEPFDLVLHETDSSALIRHNPVNGFAAGGGLALHAGPLRIAPEVRYTRWISPAFDEQGSRGFFVRSRQNTVDLLLGLSF